MKPFYFFQIGDAGLPTYLLLPKYITLHRLGKGTGKSVFAYAYLVAARAYAYDVHAIAAHAFGAYGSQTDALTCHYRRPGLLICIWTREEPFLY